MDKYIVSARKYRPSSFDAVVGQSALTTTLKNAIARGKLAHAYLFCGPRGVGKTTCARIFAKNINCLHPSPEGEACNECESCKAFEEQRSYNIHELDAASNNSVEDIRGLIEQVQIPPQVGKYKVFIIDEVHMLSQAAFNAFLKTLEEPPAHAIFILATTEKHKILPTILSRCQIFDFSRMSVSDMVRHLEYVAKNEGFTTEPEALHVIAEKADGGMRDALSIFDQVASYCEGNITYAKVIEDLNVLDYDEYFGMTDALLTGDVPTCMLRLNHILSKGFGGNYFIGGLASHFRDLLMARDAVTLPLLEVSERVAQRYQEQSAKCKPAFLYKALKVMNDCDINYRQSGNKRLLVELTLIEIAQITQPEEDGAASGRGPKRLKSLFNNIKKVMSETAKQVAGTRPHVTRHTATAEAMTDSGQHAVETPAPSRPSGMKLAHIGMTFNKLRNKQQEENTTDDDTEVPLNEGLSKKTFDNTQLLREWIGLCNRMPQQMTGIASRMKNITPTIKSFPEVEVVVDNQILLDEITKIKGRIRSTLALRLENADIVLSLRLARPEEVKKILTNRERFDQLKANNEAFSKLTEMLHLELS